MNVTKLILFYESKILIPGKLKNNINKNTIWITGTGRSGTTIIGKILASLKYNIFMNQIFYHHYFI